MPAESRSFFPQASASADVAVTHATSPLSATCHLPKLVAGPIWSIYRKNATWTLSLRPQLHDLSQAESVVLMQIYTIDCFGFGTVPCLGLGQGHTLDYLFEARRRQYTTTKTNIKDSSDRNVCSNLKCGPMYIRAGLNACSVLDTPFSICACEFYRNRPQTYRKELSSLFLNIFIC